mgnify:CR=1 FL=1
MYIIMTDTSANLEPADLKKWEIEDLPLTYMVDGKSPLDSGDAAFDGPAFYAAMRGGAKVVTSQVTPQTYIDAMTPFLKEGKDVLFIGMSSGISGSYNSAQIAANQLREEFPACKIYTIDTLSASLGEGLLVVKAAENRRSGMSIEENAAEIDKLRHNMCQVFTVDDLKYLRGTGRLSSIKAAVASVLNINRFSRATLRARSSALKRPAAEITPSRRWRSSMTRWCVSRIISASASFTNSGVKSLPGV